MQNMTRDTTNIEDSRGREHLRDCIGIIYKSGIHLFMRDFQPGIFFLFESGITSYSLRLFDIFDIANMRFITIGTFVLQALFVHALSVPSISRTNESLVIASIEDIPELPEGFSWNIVKRPYGEDKRINSHVLNHDLQPKGLEKRSTIHCKRVSIIRLRPME